MVIYIEIYFLNNFFINYLLNLIVVKLASTKILKFKVFLCSSIETLYTIFILFFDVNNYVFKIAILTITSFILSEKFNIYKISKIFIFKLIIVVIVGGIATIILNNFTVDIYSISFTLREIIVFIILFILIFFLKKIKKYLKTIKNKIKFEELIKVKNGDIEIKVLAYYDSGNKLYVNNKPICVINKNLANKLYCQVIEKCDVKTINKIDRLSVTKIDQLFFTNDKKILKDVFAVISNSDMDYDMLLNAELRELC